MRSKWLTLIKYSTVYYKLNYHGIASIIRFLTSTVY